MGHADFRRDGRIFATLGTPGPDWAMVKLPPEQQAVLLAAEPLVFTPAAGAWGRKGSTLLRLANADRASAESALHMAWQNLDTQVERRRFIKAAAPKRKR